MMIDSNVTEAHGDHSIDEPVSSVVPSEPPELTLDAVFDVLASQYRRSILSYLHSTTDGVATVDDFIEHLANHNDMQDQERLAVLLFHKALPKLADGGLIEYDSHTQCVHYLRHEVVETVLDVITENE